MGAVAITGRELTRRLFAGGGIARGRVVGSTDAVAGDVKDRPVSPEGSLGDRRIICWASTSTRACWTGAAGPLVCFRTMPSRSPK